MSRTIVGIAGALAFAWCGLAGCQKTDAPPESGGSSAGPAKPGKGAGTKKPRDAAQDRRRELVQMAKSPKAERRIMAARELAKGNASGLPAAKLLCGMLAEEDDAAARTAELEALGKVQPALRGPVATLLTDDDPPRQRDAAADLGRMGKAAAPAIVVLAKHVHDLTALKPDDERYTQGQIPGLLNADLTALLAIAPDKGQTADAILHVVRLVSDRDYHAISLRKVGIAHLRTLIETRPALRAQAVTALIPVLSEPYTARMRVAGYPDLRVDAAQVLGKCGAAAKPAVAELTRLKGSDAEEVRDAATQALQAIQGR